MPAGFQTICHTSKKTKKVVMVQYLAPRSVLTIQFFTKARTWDMTFDNKTVVIEPKTAVSIFRQVAESISAREESSCR